MATTLLDQASDQLPLKNGHDVIAVRMFRPNIGYIYHASFDDPVLAEAILGAMPDAADYDAKKTALHAPPGVLAELAIMYQSPLLARDQEAHLFRQMNYLKHLRSRAVDRLRGPNGDIDPEKVRSGDLDRIEELQAKVDAVRNQLIACNLRLVVSIVKRQARRGTSFFELLSDGNLSLIRAVDKFDFSRGNRFSTYATWTIIRNFGRSIPDENNYHERFITGHDGVFAAAADVRTNDTDRLVALDQSARRVNRLLELLQPREREIIRMRAGLGASERMTLEQIGRQLGITKERVRQLNIRIMKKLHDLAQKHITDS